MNGYLRQSTASQARLIGPFVDDTDFKTAETALTINNTDIKLRANGTTLSNKNSGGGTHQVNGTYSVTWDATDTANVGELYFSVVVAGALQVFGSYVVLEEAVYDALFAASAIGYVTDQAVNVTKWNGTAVASPHTAGYPVVTIKDGTGTGEIDTTSGTVIAGSISTGAVSADALATDAVTEIVTALLTTQMTEAYAADGVAPTLAQMQFMLWSRLAEFVLSGTTITAQKLDGSTTAMTFTLNSATTPTIIHRTG